MDNCKVTPYFVIHITLHLDGKPDEALWGLQDRTLDAPMML